MKQKKEKKDHENQRENTHKGELADMKRLQTDFNLFLHSS